MAARNGGHVVISQRVSEGMGLVRDLVSEFGLGPAAALLEEDRDQVAAWTRSDPPKRLWPRLRRLCRDHLGFSDEIPQNPSYCQRSQFSLHLDGFL